MMESNGIPEFPAQSAIGDAQGSSLLSTSTGQPGRHIVARLLKLIARRGGNVAGVLRVNGFDEPLARVPRLAAAQVGLRGFRRQLHGALTICDGFGRQLEM